MALERDGWPGSPLRHSSMSCFHSSSSRKLTTGVCPIRGRPRFFVLQRLSPTCGVSYNKAHTPGIPVYEDPPHAFVVSAAVSLSQGPTGPVRQRKRYVVERKALRGCEKCR